MSDALEFLDMGSFVSRARLALVGVQAAAMDVLGEIGETAAQDARELAPVSPPIPQANPGELAGSINVRHLKTYVTINVMAPYAYQVEYGTSKMAAEPFLRPALAKISGGRYRIRGKSAS